MDLCIISSLLQTSRSYCAIDSRLLDWVAGSKASLVSSHIAKDNAFINIFSWSTCLDVITHIFLLLRMFN